MSSDPVVMYLAGTLQQAHLLQQALARVDIEAWVEAPADSHLGFTADSALPRVVVRRVDAEDARQMAEEFDALLRLPPTESAEDIDVAYDESPPEHYGADDDAPESGEVLEAWPSCPRCQTRRNAECVHCQAAADYFPPAYQQNGERNRLWLCPTCDDVFEPRFFRRCHECGHDFGDGEQPKSLPRGEDESRAWTLLWAMLVGMLLIGGYFSWLFRR